MQIMWHHGLVVNTQIFLNFSLLRLIHKKWIYIFVSKNNDAWPLFFICYKIIYTVFVTIWTRFFFFFFRESLTTFTGILTHFVFLFFRKILLPFVSLLWSFSVKEKQMFFFVKFWSFFFQIYKWKAHSNYKNENIKTKYLNNMQKN